MKASTIVMASEPPVTESVSKLSELDHVPDASIKVIAQHVGIESLADEVARALAPDVEYRLREVIQDACKFMRHSKRTELSTDDINSSLVMRRCEPLYGFPAGAGPIPFHEVPGHPELYIPENKILDLKDILAAKLPRPPIAVNVVPHWLAVEGVQPLIPENPAPRPNVDRTPGVNSTEHDRLFRSPVIPGDVKPPPGGDRGQAGSWEGRRGHATRRRARAQQGAPAVLRPHHRRREGGRGRTRRRGSRAQSRARVPRHGQRLAPAPALLHPVRAGRGGDVAS